MRIFGGTDELERAIGEHLGYSAWHTVDQEQIDLFADATGDHQWIHVDPERAAGGLFGKTIAHGFLSLSLVPMLTAQIFELRGVSAILNYGTNKVRFPAPLIVDSRVRAGMELVGMDRSPSGYQLASRVSVEIDGGTKPACVVDALAIVVQ